MTWNYRLVKNEFGVGLHEVYYHPGNKPMAMTDPLVTADSKKDLIDTLEMMLADARKRQPLFVPPKKWAK